MDGGAASSGASTIVEHGANLAEDVADHEVVAGRARCRSEPARSPPDRDRDPVWLPEPYRLPDDRASPSSSCRSATRQIISISRFRLVFCFAETSTNTVVPPQSSGIRSAIGQLLLHAIGQCVGLVDLVDRDDDRNLRGLRVIDGFKRLRHHAVIGGHHQHDDVRDLRSACTHAGERFVTRRIEEYDLATESRRVLVRDASPCTRRCAA